MTKFDLYYHPYSICSLQVLYTFAIARAYTNAGEDKLEIEEHFVDIFKDDQLDETFLTRVNPKGQVGDGPAFYNDMDSSSTGSGLDIHRTAIANCRQFVDHQVSHGALAIFGSV
jgi:hypothetical protein